MLLSLIENMIVDDMSTRQIRYLRPVQANNATGKVKHIYRQIRNDFQLVPPLTLFSPSPELLAGVWAIWRESQFVQGVTPRSTLEAISAAVSQINECSYCVDAHSGMLHATSNHDVVNAIFMRDIALIENIKTRQIVEWALSTKRPDSQVLASPSFTKEELPEIIGTAITYHFINRMVSVFLKPSPLPIPKNSKMIRKYAVRLFGETIAKRIVKRKVVPGDSLKFISQNNSIREFLWASENPFISHAFSSFSYLIENTCSKELSENVIDIVQNQVKLWRGEDMGLSQNWVIPLVKNLNENDKPVAVLTLLVALSPYQVDDNVINNFRVIHADDRSLLYVTSWASFIAVQRINDWIFKNNN